MRPVVLHHGLFGTDRLTLGPLSLSYFRGIDRAISRRGHPLIVTRVHPSSSIENRARQLKENIQRQLEILGRPREKIILLGHSMGGLDARYAVAKLGLAKCVAAVVTICTPHRGSPVADWVMRNLGRRLRGEMLVNYLNLDLRAVLDLTTERCAVFNEQVTDVPGVAYFSVSAAAPWNRIPPFALHGYWIIRGSEGENDGLVSVKSATWATHLGTWPASHWRTINRRPLMRWRDDLGDIAPRWVAVLEQVETALQAKAEPRCSVPG